MRLLSLLTAAMLGALAPCQGLADPYPTKPIRLIVPFPAGAANDMRARLIGQRLGKALAQQVVVENRPGASGTVGAQYVAQAAPDGYTLLSGTFLEQIVAPLIMTGVGYDPQKDFVPIVPTGRACQVLVAHRSLGVSNVNELVALAKRKPGALSYGTPGYGSGHHLLMEKFKRLAGIDLVHVPYKGGAPLMQDLAAGHVTLVFDIPSTSWPYIQNGTVKPLMTGCSWRIDVLPQVPSSTESGYPELNLVGWGGLFAPAGTPPEIVARLNREVLTILSSPDVRSHLAFVGFEVPLWTQQQFADFIRQDRPRWAEVVKSAGIKAE